MFPTALLFLRPASAFVDISSYRLPSSSSRASSRPLAEAPNNEISASSGYLPTPLSLGPYE